MPPKSEPNKCKSMKNAINIFFFFGFFLLFLVEKQTNTKESYYINTWIASGQADFVFPCVSHSRII